MKRKYVTPTVVGATSAFCAVKTDRRLQALMIKDAIATAGFLIATVYETAAMIQICE